MARQNLGGSWRNIVPFVLDRRARFERLVAEALDELPEEFRAALSNVEVVIEERSDDPNLLGLYRGIPQPSRGAGYAGVLPDTITIFRESIERLATTEDELRRLVAETVVHEVAHHFGIDDDRLRELGRD